MDFDVNMCAVGNSSVTFRIRCPCLIIVQQSATATLEKMQRRKTKSMTGTLKCSLADVHTTATFSLHHLILLGGKRT